METDSQSLLKKKDEIAAKVLTLVNADLRDVCRLESLQVSGNKRELHQRILERLKQVVDGSDLAALSQLHYSVMNPQYKYRATNSANTKPDPGSTALKTSASSQTTTAAINGYLGQPAPSTMTRTAPTPASRPPLNFKPSPFYAYKAMLASQVLPVCQNHRNTVTIQIPIPEQHAYNIKHDALSRVMLYCGETPRSPLQPVQDIAFPQNIEIKANDQEIRTNTKGVKGKPGSTRPVDITAFLKKQPSAANSISITYALTTKVFTVVVMIVEKKTVDDLQRLISQRRVITKERVLADMRAKASDPDIIATSTVMSLKDPISYMRLSLPCRGTRCSHNRCFDASTFLQLQEQGPTWTCPICNNSVPFDTLAVDQYVQEILQSVPRSVDQVTIEPNGAWSLGTNNGQSGATGGSDDDDSDDLVEITDFRTNSLKTEPSSVPSSFSQRTPPFASRDATAMPIVSAPSSGRAGQKRKSEVIDLTLSDDDDEPPFKRPSYNTPNSLPDRPRNGYQLPNQSAHQFVLANGFTPFQIGRSAQSHDASRTSSTRGLVSPSPGLPAYSAVLHQHEAQQHPQTYHQHERPPSSSSYHSNRSSLSLQRPPSYGR